MSAKIKTITGSKWANGKGYTITWSLPSGKCYYKNYSTDQHDIESSDIDSYTCKYRYKYSGKKFISGKVSYSQWTKTTVEKSAGRTIDIESDGNQYCIGFEFKVKAVPKTYKKKKKSDTNPDRFSSDWSATKTFKLDADYNDLEAPSAPSIEVVDDMIRIILNDYDVPDDSGAYYATKMMVEVLRNTTNREAMFTVPRGINTVNGEITGGTITNNYSGMEDLDDRIIYADWNNDQFVVTYKFKYPNNRYSARLKACNSAGEWTEWGSAASDTAVTPATVKSTSISVSAVSSTSVKVTWDPYDTNGNNHYELLSSLTYTIGYATSEDQLTSQSGDYSSVTTSDNQGSIIITGLETGNTYYFRIQTVSSGGNSEWSDVVSITLATSPNAPTTWTSASSISYDELNTLKFYWIHNSTDDSIQTNNEIKITDSSGNSYTKQFTPDYTRVSDGKPLLELNENSSDDTNYQSRKAGTCWITPEDLSDTVSLTEGEYKWCARTKGLTDDSWSDWSVERTVTVYPEATATLGIKESDDSYVTGTLTSLPIYIEASGNYSSVQYPIGYSLTITYSGNEAYETTNYRGESIKIVPGAEMFSKYFAETMSTDMDVSFTTSSMYLTMTAGDVSFEDGYEYTCSLTIVYSSGVVKTTTSAFTVSWADVDTYYINTYLDVDESDYSMNIVVTCYDVDDLDTEIDDAVISVYRLNANGTYTCITDSASNGVTIVDPHPPLDYARYRVIATDPDTGVMTVSNEDPYEIHCSDAILQWDEDWIELYDDDVWFDFSTTDNSSSKVAKSYLSLPWNIDVSESYEVDAELVDYIGRERSVSYYGTKLGETLSFTTEFPKSNKERIYALRRVSNYFGDVYVREPNGNGSWAKVSINWNINHCELVVAATVSYTPVEGGV